MLGFPMDGGKDDPITLALGSKIAAYLIDQHEKLKGFNVNESILRPKWPRSSTFLSGFTARKKFDKKYDFLAISAN